MVSRIRPCLRGSYACCQAWRLNTAAAYHILRWVRAIASSFHLASTSIILKWCLVGSLCFVPLCDGRWTVYTDNHLQFIITLTLSGFVFFLGWKEEILLLLLITTLVQLTVLNLLGMKACKKIKIYYYVDQKMKWSVCGTCFDCFETEELTECPKFERCQNTELVDLSSGYDDNFLQQ